MSLNRDFDRLNKRLERSTERKANEVAKTYAAALKQIRERLGALYSEYEDGGRLTWEIMSKYNRASKLEDEIRKQIMRLSNDAKLLTYRHLRDTYKESYYNTAYLIERESAAKLAYSAVKPEVIERSIQNNFTGLALNERLSRNRDQLIIQMRETITRGLHEGQTYRQMTQNIAKTLEGDVVKARRIVRTESKRIREESTQAAAKHADERGVKMVKRWNTVSDERVRSSHEHLDGVTIGVDDEFEVDGFTAPAPGQFNEPSLDVNCRCFLTYEVVAVEKPQNNDVADMSFEQWQKGRVS